VLPIATSDKLIFLFFIFFLNLETNDGSGSKQKILASGKVFKKRDVVVPILEPISIITGLFLLIYFFIFSIFK
jgi:hypothetical protein